MLNLKVTLEEHYSCQCRGTANVDNMSPFDNDYHDMTMSPYHMMMMMT